MGIKRPVLADLRAQSKRFAISRQKKLDRRGDETDTVIEGAHLVTLVNTSYDHHSDQNLHVRDFSRITGEQRIDMKRAVRFDDYVHPRGWNVHSLNLFHDVIHLRDHDPVAKGG